MKWWMILAVVLLTAFDANARHRRVRHRVDSLQVIVVPDSLVVPQRDTIPAVCPMPLSDSLSSEVPLIAPEPRFRPDTVLFRVSPSSMELYKPDIFCRADTVCRVLSLPPTHKFGRWIDRVTMTKGYRMTYIGVPLVVAALIVKGQDARFRGLRHSYVPAFHYPYDDYLQYGPAALMLGLKAAGVKSRSSWGRMLVSDVFSVGLMTAIVNPIKYTARVMRPDGSARNSFPSGHTATAFMCATMLHKEYGWRSPWYSVAGYSMATVTGLSRMLNNRHWLSDVLAGAGIGILATEFGYFFADLIFKNKGINEISVLETFDRRWRPSFLGFQLSFNMIPGVYYPQPDQRVDPLTGSSIGVEGAWFSSPYLGVGGQLSIASNFLEINGRSEEEPLKSISAYAGFYTSYPLTARWVAGAKVLAGYYHFDRCDTEFLQLGDRGSFSAGAGLSMLYRAKRNMSLRFFWDFKNAPPLTSSSRKLTWVMSLGSSIDIVF